MTRNIGWVMRAISIALWCFVSALLLASCSQKETPRATPARDVNIVLITLDTTRPDYLSCYDGTRGSTPHLDSLAERGALFTDAVVQVPLTLPSHACILTGAYPQIHELRDNGGFVLKEGLPTLATVASEAGLRTGAFVGAAILNRRYGLNRGFATYSDDMGAEQESEKTPGIMAEVQAEVVTRRAVEWLDSAAAQGIGTTPGKRFLLWLHYYDPHFPYDPPEPFRSRFKADPYAGEVAYTDDQVGLLLKWLKTKNLEDQTLIIAMSDHGESLGEHGEHTHGVFLYDATMRVPLIIAGPGITPGRSVGQQVRSIDIFPTIADYLGVDNGGRSQGESLMPLLTAGRAVRTTYSYMETLYPRTSMGWSELRGVRAEDWKYIAAPKPELYRLSDDPAESRNVLNENPAEVERLRKRVWEVAGSPESLESLQSAPLDDRTRRELESLGYVTVNRKREIRIDMSGPDPKDRVKVLQIMEKTGEMINNDRYRPAIPLLSGILDADPQNPMLYTRLALCYERTGQYLKAIEVYHKAIERKVESDQTYAELGELYVRLERLDEAVPAMERASEMNPSNLQNLTNLATAYLHLGRTQDAERTLRGVLTQDSEYPEAHNIFGVLAVARGDGNLARVHFERAVQSNPYLAEAYLNLGLLAEKAAQPQQAAAYYEQFLQKASPDKHREVIPKVREALAGLKGG
jgi:choline-sulfatase